VPSSLSSSGMVDWVLKPRFSLIFWIGQLSRLMSADPDSQLSGSWLSIAANPVRLNNTYKHMMTVCIPDNLCPGGDFSVPSLLEAIEKWIDREKQDIRK
jgi:hypothetical protein